MFTKYNQIVFLTYEVYEVPVALPSHQLDIVWSIFISFIKLFGVLYSLGFFIASIK